MTIIMDGDDLVLKKAVLAMGGSIRLPDGFEIPVRVSHSTAGPGAGCDSVAFRFHGMRVKKPVSYVDGEFELHERGDGSLHLTRNGMPFIDEIHFDPIVYHCPEQAFFTLDSRCSFNCAFCASPRLPKMDYKGLTDEDIARKCFEANSAAPLKAVSLTSGVMDDDVPKTSRRFASCIREIRRLLPDVVIGIEPYASNRDEIVMFKEAGADEIKLNIQAATRPVFERVCPDLDWDNIMARIEDAVECFGRGRVTSNIIFGMGETREELGDCMRSICELGAIPTVRALRRSPFNEEPLKKAIGSIPETTPQDMVEIAMMHKSILEEYGLDTRGFGSMCLECGCCDLVPFRDF